MTADEIAARHVRGRRHHRSRARSSAALDGTASRTSSTSRRCRCRSAGPTRRSARSSTSSAPSTSSRRSGAAPTAMAPLVYTSSMGSFTADDADPVTGRLDGRRRRPPAQPLRRLQAGERGQRPDLLARHRSVERRPAADDGLRRRPRPGDDERADQGDRRGRRSGSRTGVTSAARRSSSTRRTSRRP